MCTEQNTYDFSDALRLMKDGKSLSRKGWNGRGMYCEIQNPDEHSKMTRPYIYIYLPQGCSKQFGDDSLNNMVPWLASQTDLLATDWVINSKEIN